MIKAWVFRSLVVIGLTSTALPAAQAADADYCEHYAHATLVQVRAGWSMPRCRASLSGDRWSENYRVHYDWCRGASRRDAQAERSTRTDIIESCRR